MAEMTVPNTETWTQASEATGGTYRVTLSVPAGTTGAPLPLLVLLDGETMILTATEFFRTLNGTMRGMLTPAAVVSIMSDAPMGPAYIATRFRDFTPVEWVLPGPFAPDNGLVTLGTGGADRFVTAIADEIIPRVRDFVSVDPARTGVCGWSLSGLFAAHAWSSRPDVFADLVAISPSLWWNDASMIQAPLARRPEGHRAIITAGEHEEGDPSLVWPPQFAHVEQREKAAMVRNATAFARMTEAAGARTHLAILADEHHMTLVPASLARALVKLYG